jgi:hypothetical protein
MVLFHKFGAGHELTDVLHQKCHEVDQREDLIGCFMGPIVSVFKGVLVLGSLLGSCHHLEHIDFV